MARPERRGLPPPGQVERRQRGRLWRRLDRVLAPTVWLSGRLSFSAKYLLVGGVMLAALLALSWPVLHQARTHSQQAQEERLGLQGLAQHSQLLLALVQQRSAVVAGGVASVTAPPAVLNATAMQTALQNALQAPTGSAGDPSVQADLQRQLAQRWAELQGLNPADDDAQRRFAAHTGVINALLALMRDSARSHRLNTDPELDAAFDTLSHRLPLVMETLAKQQDVLLLGREEMASYALGAQVVLSESALTLRAGVAQLLALAPQAGPLQTELGTLLADIARQQDAADSVAEQPAALAELRRLASANLQRAQSLLAALHQQCDAQLQRRQGALARTQAVVAALLLGALAAIAYLFAGIYLSTLRSLTRLSQGTQAFCAGALDTRITLATQDELVQVARNFNTVADEVSRLLEVIRQQNESRQRELEHLVQQRTAELAERNAQLHAAGLRVQEELQLARDMQQAILPQHFAAGAGWSVHACMNPARELGGDFYDCFALPGGRQGLLVADVAGKGVGAAFFMAVSRTVLQDLALADLPPSQVLARANQTLCERNPMALFVTACYVIYDPSSGHLVYASAGHLPPLLRRSDAQVQALPCPGDVALGVLPDQDYGDRHARLGAGDTLLLYTDGVTEAFDAQGQAFGDARLLRWLAGQAAGPAQALVAALVDEVARFVAGAEASDDLTCLVLSREEGVAPMSLTAPELGPRTLLLEYALPSRLDEIAGLANAVDQALAERSDLAFAVNLCLEELITNTIQHGLQGRPDRRIQVRLSRSAEWLEIIVKDDAPPFDPFAQAPLPDLDAALEDRAVGGLGVHMVKTMMDEVRAYYDGSGNLIVLLKTLRQ